MYNAIYFPPCKLMATNRAQHDQFVMVDFSNQIHLVSPKKSGEIIDFSMCERFCLHQHEADITSIVIITMPINRAFVHVMNYILIIFSDINGQIFALFLDNDSQLGYINQSKTINHLDNCVTVDNGENALAISNGDQPVLVVRTRFNNVKSVCFYTLDISRVTPNFLYSPHEKYNVNIKNVIYQPLILDMQHNLIQLSNDSKTLITTDEAGQSFCQHFPESNQSYAIMTALPESKKIYDVRIKEDNTLLIAFLCTSENNVSTIEIRCCNLQQQLFFNSPETQLMATYPLRDISLPLRSLKLHCRVTISPGLYMLDMDNLLHIGTNHQIVTLGDRRNFRYLLTNHQHRLYQHEDCVYDFSATGDSFIIATADGDILIFDLNSGNILHRIPHADNTPKVKQIKSIPNSSTFIILRDISGAGHRIDIYHSATAGLIGTINYINREEVIGLDVTPNGEKIIVIVRERDRKIKLQFFNCNTIASNVVSVVCDTNINLAEADLTIPQSQITCNASGLYFAYVVKVGSHQLCCQIWNTKTHQLLHQENFKFIDCIESRLCFVTLTSLLVMQGEHPYTVDFLDGDLENIALIDENYPHSIACHAISLPQTENFSNLLVDKLFAWLKQKNYNLHALVVSNRSSFIAMRIYNNQLSTEELYIQNLTLPNFNPILLRGRDLPSYQKLKFSADGLQLLLCAENQIFIWDLSSEPCVNMPNKEIYLSNRGTRLIQSNAQSNMIMFAHLQDTTEIGHFAFMLSRAQQIRLQKFLILILAGFRRGRGTPRFPRLPPELWIIVYEMLRARES